MNNIYEKIFGLCVDLLVWSGNLLGLTYVQINVIIFCIIEPIIFIVMLYIIINQYRKLKDVRLWKKTLLNLYRKRMKELTEKLNLKNKEN